MVLRSPRSALRRAALAAVATLLLPHVASAQVSPEESLKSFQVADGVEVKLFAAEPMLINPCDMEVDAHGRVWITEGANYRRWNGIKPEGDRIVVLEDKDGDGKADTSTVFYQGKEVNAALGICVLGNKVIVSCSPNVFIFTDEDGDLKADKKEVFFTGIGGVQHDHGAHAFVFGPDGKLYFNIGNDGRQISRPDGKLVVDKAGNEVSPSGKRSPESGRSGKYTDGLVFRCNPDGTEFETLGWNFRNNYEVQPDSFGTIWQSDNDDDGNRGTRINFVMEFGNYGYKDEMTGAGWQQRRTNIEQEIPLRHWHLNDPGVVPNLIQTYQGSPTGICIYEGNLLPEVFRNQILHTDAGPNVVRAYPVTNDGAGYKATIADLIKGGDKWFRPSDVTVAPDGSVFVSDWYDPGVGGHNMQDSNDNAAKMRGRVFRLAPPGVKYNVPKLDLSTTAGAIEALKSPNGSRRYLGWTTLNKMGEKAEADLQKLWKDSNPRLRARALHLLARIPNKSNQYVNEAVRDANSDIRITGLRIARDLKMDTIALVKLLAKDESPQVRRECLIALRHSSDSEAPTLWADLASQHDGKDRWYLEALGIAADRNEDKFFDAWLKKVGDNWNNPAGRDVIWRSRARAVPALLTKILNDPATPASDKPRYLRAFDFVDGPVKADQSSPQKVEALLALTKSSDSVVATEALTRLSAVPSVAAQVRPMVEKILSSARGTPAFVDLIEQFDIRDRNNELLALVVADPASPAAANATRLLVRNDMKLIEKTLAGPDSEQLATALGGAQDQRVGQMLQQLVSDEKRDLAARRAAVKALARGRTGAFSLLEMVRNKKVPAELQSAVAAELHRNTNQRVRDAARELLPQPPTKDGQPLPPMEQLAKMTGDVARGKTVFAANCAVCHQVNGEGTNFGPALTEIGTKLGKDALYTSILYPSAGIEHNYEGHVIRTKADELVGLLVSETADELQLRIAGGAVQTLKKSDILNRRIQKESIMPENLPQGMTVQELADLVEYLTTLKK